MSDHSLLRTSGQLLLCLLVLLACGIYSHMSWNLVYISFAIILSVALHFFSKPHEAIPVAPGKGSRPKRVCLVVGPYAANWFATQRGMEALRCYDNTVWFAARDTLELIRLLNQFSSHEGREPVTLFFPFLPDGHETTALACESLLAWQKTLQMLILSKPLPCIFALYARCSQQRFAHDPDRAIWAGLELPEGEGLDPAISALLAQFGAQPTANEGYILQRKITLAMLQEWMKETPLLSLLDGLLNSPSVRLQQVLLADYGNGFIRHGAWSRWLEDSYGMLPSLAKSRIELPLPEFTPSALPTNESLPAPRSRTRLLLLPAFTLVIAGSMYGSFAWEQQRVSTVTGLMEQAKNLPGDDIQGQFAVVHQLEKQASRMAQCADSFFFQNWGFSRCTQLLPVVDNFLDKYEHWVVYSSTSSSPLFASGRADIIPEQAQNLSNVLSLIEKNPEINFVIIGHTDNSGDEKNNLSLSLARARAVRTWILGKTSIPVERLRIKGVGDAFPVNNNDTKEEKAANRRVEMIPLRPYN